MEIQDIHISHLKTNDRNPRSISMEKFDKLVDSLLTFPAMIRLRPIVVDETNTALGGNMRTKAFGFISGLGYGEIVARLNHLVTFANKPVDERDKILTHWEKWLKNPVVPVVRADSLTEEERKQFVIADNVPFGEWDFDMLANEWDEDLLKDFGMDLPWLEDFGESEDSTSGNSDGVPGATDEAEGARCKPGDVWILGAHRLECGDKEVEMCESLLAAWEELTGRKAKKV